MAKIFGNFPSFSTINSCWSQKYMDISTILIGWLTFLVQESKLKLLQTKGGVTMESGTSGNIPGRSRQRAMVRP